jgi:hypothetical protein
VLKNRFFSNLNEVSLKGTSVSEHWTICFAMMKFHACHGSYYVEDF